MEASKEKFTMFWNGPFSQWHSSFFTVDGITYNCAEQFMMASKARVFKDTITEEEIMRTLEPAAQKKLGRKVLGFIPEKWNAVARELVYKGSHAKFTQNKELKQILLATVGTTLVEASPYDTIWGIGLIAEDPRARDRATWKGTNWLGEVLTKLREDLLNA